MLTKEMKIGYRFALTTALVFIAGMLINWESAYLAAVYVTILLEKDAKIPLRKGVFLLLTTFAIYVLVYCIFTLLLQYPLFFFLSLAIGLACVFSMSIKGKSSLLVTLSLFAVIILPYTTSSSTEAAWNLAIWMPLNLLIALGASWCAFAVIPPHREDTAPANQEQFNRAEGKVRFIQMMLTVAPIVVIFQLIDGDHLLTILYFSLFSVQLIAPGNNSSIKPHEKLIANLFAVLASLVAYELLVVVPTIAMLSLVSLLLCLIYGWWLSSRLKNANLARSGLTGAIILLGGSIAPMADTVEVASIERVLEISAAVILVTLLFVGVSKFFPIKQSPATQDIFISKA